MEINDTLKFKSFGWKKDYESKKPHIAKVLEQHRQYYPEDAHGVIDEWKALIRNQAEIFEQDERLHQENKYQAKEDYRAELDRQIKEKQFREQADKDRRKNEGNMLANQTGVANQLNQQIKNLGQVEKDKLNEAYCNAIEDNRRKALDAKEHERLEDQNMLNNDRYANRNSQRALKDRNREYKKDLDNVADYHNYLKNQLAADQKQQEDEEYIRGCQRENEKRDKEKEDWFNKYKKFSNDMDDKLKATLNQAKPILDRQKKIDDKINGDFDKYGNKLFEDHDKNRRNLDGQWRNAGEENRRNIKTKTRGIQMGKLKEKEEMDNQMREVMAYSQNKEKKRRDMEDQKNLYRETLQNQMTLNALNKHNFGKMTMNEKYLNKPDLRAYKNKERNSIKAMIPGIKNISSIGTKPLMRGAMNVMDFSDSPPHGPTGRKGQMFFSPEPKQPEGFIGKPSYQNPLPHQPANMRNISGTLQRAVTPGRTMNGSAISKTDFERFKASTRNNPLAGSISARNTQSMASIYNPIVHPIDKSYKIYP